MLGDVNGHHTTWGSPRNNTRGSIIANLAEQHDLIIINDGSNTFTRPPIESAIDISAVSGNIAHRLAWKVSDDPGGSDHFPIFITVNDNPPETSRRPRWLYDRADWEGYEISISSICQENPPLSLDELTENMVKAANQAIPKSKANPGPKPLHWWSPTTKAAVKARHKALRAAKRLPQGHPDKEKAIEVYHSARNQCRQTIRDAKKASWESFLDEINANQSASEIWQRINAIRGSRRARGFTLRGPNGITRDPEEIANLLGDYFESLSSLGNYDEGFRNRNSVSTSSINNFQIPDDGNDLTINRPFTMEELGFALRKAKGKSAGPDEVGYPMIRNLPPTQKATLLELFNQAWTDRQMPNTWKHSLIVPIPKNPGPALLPKDFRPISLTSCCSKIMERLVNRRLTGFLERNSLLDHRQHAFRRHGTGTYFNSLGQIVQEALRKDQHVELASLDLAKAYNRAWTPQVLHQLSKWGLGGNILYFLRNYLQDRTFQVTIGNHRSNTRREETGVPQGSVIAVTIFLVAMNGIFVGLPKEIYILVYADDILLLVVGKTLKAMKVKLQAAVSAVGRWAAKTGFAISAEKSSVSHVCRHGHRPLPTPIRIDKQAIPRRKSISILGVTIDRNFRFGPHLNEVKANCRTRLNILRSLSGPHKVNNRGIVMNTARSIVHSRLTYGIELLCASSDSIISRLAPIYNQATRIAAGLLPSTPADAACIETGTLPFRFFIAESVCTRAVGLDEQLSGDGDFYLLSEGKRILQETAHQELPPVSKLHWVGAREWDASPIRSDRTMANRFRAGDNSAEMRTCLTERLRTMYHNHQLRYTDGSKARGRVGFGVTDGRTSHFWKLPDQCSVFSAEAAALHYAASLPSSSPLCILTDSASALAALESSTARHPWIQAIQKHTQPGTTFMWIPGHCGIAGNIEADHLAATGRSGRLAHKSVPRQDLKVWIKSTIRSAWGNEWNSNQELFIRKVKGETAPWTDTKSYAEQRILSRLRTGHTRITHNMGSSSGGGFRRRCDACRTTMTVEHILINCPCFHGSRELYGLADNIRDVLQNDPVAEIQLICFTKEAGIYKNI